MGNLKEQLPSGQFAMTAAAIFAVALIIGIASIYPAKGSLNYQNPNAELETGTLEKLVAVAGDLDTDKDGLKDWEESLWKTDPKNPDTDGDGTFDGEEVKANRNPKVIGPNDKMSSEEVESVTQGDVPQTTNATDRLARSFFTEYVTVKKSGATVDATNETKIINAALSQTNPQPARQYTEGELEILQNSSESTLRSYANAMGIIQAEHAISTSGSETELSIFAKAISKEDEKELLKLTPIINRYKSMLQALLKLPVPKDLETKHLALVNAISMIGNDVAHMQNAFTDPVQAMVSFSEYTNITSTVPDIYKNFRDYYTQKNILFSTNDPAYSFLNSYKK